MDTAIKAEWYDLDDADREDFLAWLHGKHLPALQARPGHIWIGHYNRAPQTGKTTPPGHPPRRDTTDPNVPRGSQYLLVTAAASPDVFFDPNVTAETDTETVARLAKRKEYRFGIFIEETRVSGPDWYRHLPGTGAPPAIQLGNYLTSTQKDDMDLALWYRTMKLPQVTRARGCIGARKLVSLVGWAKHGIMYEFESLEARTRQFEEPEESKIVDPKEWTGRIVRTTLHTPGSPVVGERIWPPVV